MRLFWCLTSLILKLDPRDHKETWEKEQKEPWLLGSAVVWARHRWDLVNKAAF